MKPIMWKWGPGPRWILNAFETGYSYYRFLGRSRTRSILRGFWQIRYMWMVATGHHRIMKRSTDR